MKAYRGLDRVGISCGIDHRRHNSSTPRSDDIIINTVRSTCARGCNRPSLREASELCKISEMKSTNEPETSKELKGDGLRLVMEVNDLKLKVFGDGCRVTVGKNCGSIRVVGDGCSLKVNRNDGDIEYEGDGGCIFLGGGSRTDSVSYVGDGGRITVGRKKDRRVRKEDKTGCVSDSELEMNRENAANETKEAKERARKTFVANQQRAREFRGGSGTNLRRSKTTTVVADTSSNEAPLIVNTTKRLTKNWFRNPVSVITTFESDPESR